MGLNHGQRHAGLLGMRCVAGRRREIKRVRRRRGIARAWELPGFWEHLLGGPPRLVSCSNGHTLEGGEGQEEGWISVGRSNLLGTQPTLAEVAVDARAGSVGLAEWALQPRSAKSSPTRLRRLRRRSRAWVGKKAADERDKPPA